MKKGLALLLILSGLFINLFSQTDFDSIQIKQNLDEILLEADILYRFEKAAWISIDLALSDFEVKQTFKDYFVYSSGDSVKAIIINSNNQCSYELTFIDKFDKPTTEVKQVRDLTSYETQHLMVKSKMLTQISKPKYEVGCPDGFGLNMVFLPSGQDFKLYILTGTSQSDMIPFGNDFLFVGNEKGKIKSWKKFHSRLIPTMTKMDDGMKLLNSMHSHLKTEPYITATDICTFRLYGELCGQEEFTVYSTALRTSFKYNLINNNITIKDL